ncbi:MAG: hypothetical protein ACRBCT_07195 [Alphaproteobacteria bacterium]
MTKPLKLLSFIGTNILSLIVCFVILIPFSGIYYDASPKLLGYKALGTILGYFAWGVFLAPIIGLIIGICAWIDGSFKNSIKISLIPAAYAVTVFICYGILEFLTD